MPSLTKADTNKGRVVFATTIVAMLIQQVGRTCGLTDDRMPAVQQCTILIGELLDPLPAEVRNVLIHRVNKQRRAITADTHKLDAGSALIASIETLCGPLFRSKPGTRFDYIRQTLRENIEVFKDIVPHEHDHIAIFARHFKKRILEG